MQNMISKSNQRGCPKKCSHSVRFWDTFLDKKEENRSSFGIIESPQPYQERTVFLCIFIITEINSFCQWILKFSFRNIILPDRGSSREKMDPALLASLYPGVGRPAYHPKMMLKGILYAYANRIYSSRQIAKQLKENIYFMWLSGHQTPDFRTINRFRSEGMKDIIYETFFSIVDLLHQEGLFQLENYFLDGMKIEANANKYTFVWRKSTEKYDQKLEEKFRKIVASIEQVMKEDEEAKQEGDFQEKLEAAPITRSD